MIGALFSAILENLGKLKGKDASKLNTVIGLVVFALVVGINSEVHRIDRTSAKNEVDVLLIKQSLDDHFGIKIQPQYSSPRQRGEDESSYNPTSTPTNLEAGNTALTNQPE